jgi:hypothetical protein
MRHSRGAGLTVQLMAVQMLSAGVALAAALVRAFELLVEALSAAPSLPRGAMAVTLAVTRVAILVAVASAATSVAAVGGGGGWRLVCRANRRVHLVSELRLDLAQIRRVRSMHRQDLRRHCQWAGSVQCRVSRLWRGVRVSGAVVDVV